MTTKELPRFEVRDCRTGFIEAVYGTIEPGIEYAKMYKGEGFGPCFIVDCALPLVPDDLRIVWRDAEPRPMAVEWVRKHQTVLEGA